MAGANVAAIGDSDFEAMVLQSDVPVLLDFTAVWCAPCRAIAPLLDQLAAQQQGKLKVFKMDIDQNQNVPMQFHVQSIPTLILFQGGKVVTQHVGSLNMPKLQALVSPVIKA